MEDILKHFSTPYVYKKTTDFPSMEPIENDTAIPDWFFTLKDVQITTRWWMKLEQ